MKVGDLVRIKERWATIEPPQVGLIIRTMNDYAFKVWLTDGQIVGKLRGQLDLLSQVEDDKG